jgi:hypothetical protein
MNKYKFLTFCEFADFGFKQDIVKPPTNDPNAGPLRPLNVEYITRALQRLKMPMKETQRFFGELQWGDNAGAVRLQFSPFGGLRAIVRKLSTDLMGEQRWICKRVVEVRHLFDEFPDKLTLELDKVINEVSNENIDAPSNTFEQTERLVLHMASKLRQARSDLFFFEGIRRTKENLDYSIHMGLHGHGMQRKDQKRVDEFIVRVAYHQNEGYIQIIGQEIDGPTRRHDWAIEQSQWNENYMPSQSIEEIVETQYHMLRSF